MITPSKKLLSLFLIFSLLMINCATLRRLEEKREKREKRGAVLIIQKIDGQQVRGELNTVKPNSLLLLDTEGKDVSIDIVDIKVIGIVKKSKALSFAGIGLLAGGGIGVLVGSLMSIDIWGVDESEGAKVAQGATIGGCVGAFIGGIFGEVVGTDKTIRIEGMTDLEIQKTLDKLRKKARIRDYK